MALKRQCQNCRHFQDAGFARGGWCNHPARKTSKGNLILVRGSELACRDDWGASLWESVYSQMDDSLVRLIHGSAVDQLSGDNETMAPLEGSRNAQRPSLTLHQQPTTEMATVAVAPSRQLRVFLCHASDDKPVVRSLYQRLVKNGIEAWLDEEYSLPGQDWQLEITNAVRRSDVVIVCLTSTAVSKTGFVQKEIRFALDIAEEQPEGSIFLVPVRLEECPVPVRLQRYQWANLYASDGFDRLMRSLQNRSEALRFVDESKLLGPLTKNQSV